MSPKVQLQTDISDILARSACDNKSCLEAVTEALVRRVLHKTGKCHISADDRRQAHYMLSWWFSSLHEQDVSAKWNEAKMERILKS